MKYECKDCKQFMPYYSTEYGRQEVEHCEEQHITETRYNSISEKRELSWSMKLWDFETNKRGDCPYFEPRFFKRRKYKRG